MQKRYSTIDRFKPVAITIAGIELERKRHNAKAKPLRPLAIPSPTNNMKLKIKKQLGEINYVKQKTILRTY